MPEHNCLKQMLENDLWKRLWIVTGGQTGVDRAAMDLALEFKLPLRGWCPHRRLAEDGAIHSLYPLQETISDDPALRTEMNVIDSDGTLIITDKSVKDGTTLTEECARYYERPLFRTQLFTLPGRRKVKMFRNWVENNNIQSLNIAGPRESHLPGKVYSSASLILKLLLVHDTPK